MRPETEENLPKYDGPLRVDVRCADTGEERVNYIGEEKPESDGEGFGFEIRLSETGKSVGWISLDESAANWQEYDCVLNNDAGVFPLYLVFHGKTKVQLESIRFLPAR